MVIGLTGGIGSGKSTVAQYLKKNGIPVTDADEIAIECLKMPSVIRQIVTHFGKDVLNVEGKVSRKKIGNIAFRSSEKLKCLEKIIHPIVIRSIQEKIQMGRDKISVYTVPLLLEKKLERLFDYIVVVDAPRHCQVERASKRLRISREAVRLRMKNQMHSGERRKRADFIIKNAGTKQELFLKTKIFLEKLKSIKKRS